MKFLKILVVPLVALILGGCTITEAFTVGGGLTGAAITRNPYKGFVGGALIGAGVGNVVEGNVRGTRASQIYDDGDRPHQCDERTSERWEGARKVRDSRTKECRNRYYERRNR